MWFCVSNKKSWNVSNLALWKGGHCAIVPEMGEMFASGTRIVIQPLHQLTIPSKNNKSFWSKTYLLVRVLGLLQIRWFSYVYHICKKIPSKICRAVEKGSAEPLYALTQFKKLCYKKVYWFWVGFKIQGSGSNIKGTFLKFFMSFLYRMNLKSEAQGRWVSAHKDWTWNHKRTRKSRRFRVTICTRTLTRAICA